MKKILLTGDRPTGALHLGHYLGSLKNRVQLQSVYDSYILIADMQALTDNYHQPLQVKENIFEVLADYLAVGINPKESTIFLQSQVPQLFELTAYLSNLVSFDYLKHNPTLKTELEQKKINNLGFISYPVSQAADILAFRAEIVPVGNDQSPILELTNKVGAQFNEMSKSAFFPKVQGLYSSHGRVKGIDGKSKMSKSLNNAIYLKDEFNTLKKKVNSMYTDPLHVRVEDPGHLEDHVVFMFLEVFDKDMAELEVLKKQYQKGGIADGDVKKRLLEILEELISPIREERKKIIQDKAYLQEVLKQGSLKAQEKAEENVKFVREYFTLKL